MGMAWQLYLVENKSRLPENIGFTFINPESSYRGNWLGILDSYKVRGDSLICPSAREPIPFQQPNKGFGTSVYSWNGKLTTGGSLVRLAANTFRVGSYGYNKNLTAGGGYGTGGRATRINSVRPSCEAPVIVDAVYAEILPQNYNDQNLVPIPPNLTYDDIPYGAPEHWKFLIARHGRGINGYMADGSARRIPLEETYQLMWSSGWNKYRLQLPAF
jgi:prepilin-type processing-associated H-X9-DG protein